MCLLIESIKLKDGKFYHLDLHQNRMNYSIKKLCKIKSQLLLEQILQAKNYSAKGLYKCRIVYKNEIEEIEFTSYKKKEILTVRLIEKEDITYSYKYLDRSFFVAINEQFPGYDEYIITKKGFITDATYANVIFWNGREWHTSNTPLLKGIQREYLLSNGLIKEKQITIHDLSYYSKFALINAMMDMEDKIELSIDQLII